MEKKKWGIIVDSSCGFSKKQIEKWGYFYVPFFINVDGNEYIDGETIDDEKIRQLISQKKKINTATQNSEYIKNIYQKALKKFEKVAVITISRYLSGMNNAFQLAAVENKFSDKIFILESNLISIWTRKILSHIANSNSFKNKSFDELKDFLQQINKYTICTINLQDIEPLSQGGRITKSQSALINLTHIKPTLIYKDGKIDPNTTIKARNEIKSVKKSLVLIKKYLVDNKLNIDDFYLEKLLIEDEDIDKIIDSEVKKILPKIEVKKNESYSNTSVLLVHVGYKVFSIALLPKIIM